MSGIWVKVFPDDDGGGGELPGIGGWADVSAVTGTGTKYEYTADGMDWSAFEWTDDGSLTIQSEGVVDMLLVASGSSESNNAGGKGGGVISGVESFYSGKQDIVIGKSGGSDVAASYIYQSNGEVDFIGTIGGGWGSPANAGNGGADLTGNGVFSRIKDGTKIGYGGGALAGTTDPDRDYGQGDPARPNSGGASTRKSPAGAASYGANGVCIIRVPRSNDKTGLPAGPFDTTTLRDKAKEAVKTRRKTKD